jgi:nitroreductase
VRIETCSSRRRSCASRPRIDAFLAISSKRDERAYAGTPIPDDVVERILDAGRLSGSARNRQEWTFVVVGDRAAFSETVYAPENVSTATLVVAIVGASGFDAGRCAQNMMLAAWNDGVVSCPNGVRDPEGAARIAGGAVGAVISFGYAATQRDPESRTAAEWSARAKRKPLDELVRRR